MAYEESYEDILERCLDRVSDTVDKREGSVIYDAIAPCALEICQLRIQLDEVENNSFGDTADREHLIRRAREQGVIPKEASASVLKGVSEPALTGVEIGTRFSLDDLTYYVSKEDGDGIYELTCETVGVEGNRHFGVLTPVEYVEGLGTMTITEVLIPGEDEEDTELFRERYYETFDDKAYGGNCTDYIQKTMSISGVGACKVTPVWNGGGTVLLTILGSDYNKATDTLIGAVQETIDPTKDASGIGVAPIGHVVTVQTAKEVQINVSTSLTFQEGYTFESLRTSIEDTISNYLAEIRQSWGKSQSSVIKVKELNKYASVVRISQIETRLLNLTGIIDIAGTTINDGTGNLALSDYEIPVMGVVTNA